MDIRQSPLILGFSLGRFFDVTVKVSVWFLALVFLLCVRLPIVIGLWTSLLLFVSILIHEFAHVFGARRTGGHGDEILMWPFGGLAFVSPAGTFRSEIWTTAAGPLSNLAICLICLPAVISSGVFWDCLRPVVLPPLDFSLSNPSTMVTSIFVLMFALNFKLFVFNLLPIHPLDGGQIAFSVAKLRWDQGTAKIGTLYLGIVACLIVAIIGVWIKSTDLVAIGLVLMTLGFQAHLTAVYAERFGGGFEYGPGGDDDEYGLFEEKREPQPGMMERWKQRREEKRLAKEAELQAETTQKVDALLEKINSDGMDALTAAEKKFLQQASSRYKTQSD